MQSHPNNEKLFAIWDADTEVFGNRSCLARVENLMKIGVWLINGLHYFLSYGPVLLVS